MNPLGNLCRLAPLGLGALVCCSWRLQACATCFGRSDSPLAQGMNMGILALLGVVLGVLAACVAFFVHIARRAARLAAEGETVPDRPLPRPTRS